MSTIKIQSVHSLLAMMKIAVITAVVLGIVLVAQTDALAVSPVRIYHYPQYTTSVRGS